jgi:hypothetical protein
MNLPTKGHNPVGASIAAGNMDSTHNSAGSCTMPQEDELAHALEECLSIFQSGLIQNLLIEDLVFCNPSENYNPRTPPSLQSLATTNIEFLQYESWITTLYKGAEKLDCGKFKHCESIRGWLLDELKNEHTKLDELKLRAWQLASQKDFNMPSSSEPGMAQIIDTCEYYRNCR